MFELSIDCLAKEVSAMPVNRNAILALCLALIVLGCTKRPDEQAMTTNDKSDEKGLFLSWQHPVSRRHAILEEQGGTAWLYLTAPDSMKPDRDCPAFTTMQPAEKVDWKLIEKTGQPPPITKDIATASATIEHPSASEFKSVWSADGQSVALVRSGQIISMIVVGAKHGHSRAIAKESPLGLPFDETLASQTFPEFPK